MMMWMSSYLLSLTKEEEDSKNDAGIGLVLDTRVNFAQAELNELNRQLRERTKPTNERELEDMVSVERVRDENGSEDTSAAKPVPISLLRERISCAQEELEATKQQDAIIVVKQHKEGPAYLSGKIANLDIIIAVDGKAIGTDLEMAGFLIRGISGTRCTLRIQKSDGKEMDIELIRKKIPNHVCHKIPSAS